METQPLKLKFSDKEILRKFGPIEHYNALIFDYMVATGPDTEGALAIGGDAQFANVKPWGATPYDVGGAIDTNSNFIGKYYNPKNYPSLMLGGGVDPKSGYAQVYGGHVVRSDLYQEDAQKFPYVRIEYVPNDMVKEFFQRARSRVACISEKFMAASTKTVTSWQISNISSTPLKDYVVPELYPDAKVVVLTLNGDADGSVIFNEFKLDDAILDYEAIIINVPAKTVAITGGSMRYNGNGFGIFAEPRPENEIVKKLAARLVFHFPNATSVDISYFGLVGSVIAPKAKVTCVGGSINGMLIADSFIQKDYMEMHAFTIPREKKIWWPCNLIEIVKEDANNKEIKLEGAEFDLFQYNEDTGEYERIDTELKTSAGGILHLEDLAVGKYMFKEVKSPKGYILLDNTEIPFEIK